MRRLALPVGFVLVAVTVLALRLLSADPAPPRITPSYPDFPVRTASGAATALAKLRDERTVVVFGYTSCPDICPTTLARLGAAFRQLPEPMLEATRAVFVSVDPARDTPERLARYARAFHPRFVGVAVDPATLAGLRDSWGIFYEKHEGGSAMGYTMDHSTQAFLLDEEGEVVTHVPHDASPEAMAQTLRRAHRSGAP